VSKERRRSSAPITSRQNGIQRQPSRIQATTDHILTLNDHACTEVAFLTHEVATLAARTEDAFMVRLALYLERIACELHAIGQVLPAALMLATLESAVAA
jgi:hypothetical protein